MTNTGIVQLYNLNTPHTKKSQRFYRLGKSAAKRINNLIITGFRILLSMLHDQNN